jgi:hypothetical protein
VGRDLDVRQKSAASWFPDGELLPQNAAYGQAHEREVGIPSLWALPKEFSKSAEWTFFGNLTQNNPVPGFTAIRPHI